MRSLSTAVFLLSASLSFGRIHEELNGTWVLLPQPTVYHGEQVTESGTVTIDIREGNVAVIRDFTFRGKAHNFRYHDIADGPMNSTLRAPQQTTHLRWEHTALRLQTIRDGEETVDTFSLAPDGTMTDIVESPGRAPVALMFHRQ